MHENTYLPKGLPFLPDGMLRLTAREYRRIYDDLSTPAGVSADPQRRAELAEALRAIEAELHARGIGGAPWWSSTEARNEA